MCTACYALRNIKHIVLIDTLGVIYFTLIHSIISYGIIFWGQLLREVGGGGNWMELAQDRDRWQTLVNTVMYLQVP